MARKLAKAIEGTVVKITAGGKEMKYDFAALPKEIQAKLGPFGLGHKLGDAAAGKSGEEIFPAIKTVFDGLMASNWSVRAPAGEKVSKKSLSEGIGKLSPKEQEAAMALLAKLGIKM